MKNMKQRLPETVDFIRSRIKNTPYIGLLTGTGLRLERLPGNCHAGPISFI
jgi:hypothetical protein